MIVGLDPTSGPLRSAEGRPATRPSSLDGAVIGLVANGLGRSQELMRALYDELRACVSPAGAVPVLKASVSVPPEPMDWEKLIAETTVAVAGFGG